MTPSPWTIRLLPRREATEAGDRSSGLACGRPEERSPSPHILIAAAVGLAGVGLSLALLPFPAAGFAAALAVIAVAIAAVDIERLIIPDSANAALLGLGFALALSDAPSGGGAAALVDAGLRVGAGFLAFAALRALYRRASGQEGLGFGDVKLAGAGAAWLSWSTLPLVVELAALSALLAVLGRRLLTGRGIERGEPLPFGAFLAPALWASFLAERLGFPEVLAMP